MSKKDLRVNEFGVNIKDVEPGVWVTTRWTDAPDQPALVLDVEERQATYKGNRSIRIFYQSNTDPKVGFVRDTIDLDQIVSIDGVLNMR